MPSFCSPRAEGLNPPIVRVYDRVIGEASAVPRDFLDPVHQDFRRVGASTGTGRACTSHISGRAGELQRGEVEPAKRMERRHVSAGTYFVRLEAGSIRQVSIRVR